MSQRERSPKLFVAVFEHSLKAFAIIVGTCHGTVYVFVNDYNVIALCVLVAIAKLSLDRLFCLPVT